MPIIVAIFIAFFSQMLCASEIQEFTAEYEILYGDISLGKAHYRFSNSQGDHYRFDFSSELRFLIFSDVRVVKSELTYEDAHLVTRYYSHDRKGTGRDYFEEILFDRSENLIRSTYQGESIEFVYEKDIVDGLTVQLLLMLDLQKGNLQPSYKILDANRIREREFRFVGEESITIQSSDYHSVIYEVVRDNNRRKTQMWFSPERNYLPLQMVHYSRGKKKFNAHLLNYHESDSVDSSGKD